MICIICVEINTLKFQNETSLRYSHWKFKYTIDKIFIRWLKTSHMGYLTFKLNYTTVRLTFFWPFSFLSIFILLSSNDNNNCIKISPTQEYKKFWRNKHMAYSCMQTWGIFSYARFTFQVTRVLNSRFARLLFIIYNEC